MVETGRPPVQTHEWEYEVIEEPNLGALQDRLTIASAEGWEPMNVGCAGEGRLLALLKRRSNSEHAPAKVS